MGGKDTGQLMYTMKKQSNQQKRKEEVPRGTFGGLRMFLGSGGHEGEDQMQVA